MKSSSLGVTLRTARGSSSGRLTPETSSCSPRTASGTTSFRRVWRGGPASVSDCRGCCGSALSAENPTPCPPSVFRVPGSVLRRRRSRNSARRISAQTQPSKPSLCSLSSARRIPGAPTRRERESRHLIVGCCWEDSVVRHRHRSLHEFLSSCALTSPLFSAQLPVALCARVAHPGREGAARVPPRQQVP
jgi:hypothetical protein